MINFSLRISLVNVNKSAENCILAHIYWIKLHCLCIGVSKWCYRNLDLEFWMLLFLHWDWLQRNWGRNCLQITLAGYVNVDKLQVSRRALINLNSPEFQAKFGDGPYPADLSPFRVNNGNIKKQYVKSVQIQQ